MKQITPTQRQMSEREMTLSLTTSTACHLLIRNLDDLSQTTFYSQKLKNYGNQFLRELELHTKKQVWNSTDIEDIDLDVATNQTEELSNFLQDLFIIGLGIGYIEPEKLNSFWDDMRGSFNKHGIPLQISKTGELSLKRLKLEEV